MQVQAIKYSLCLSFRCVDLKEHHTASSGDVIRRAGNFALVLIGRGYMVRDLSQDQARGWRMAPGVSFHETLLGGLAGLARAHQGLPA